jgi:integrase
MASTWQRRHGHELRTRLLLDTLKGVAKESPPPHKSKPLMVGTLIEILDHLNAVDAAPVRAGGLLTLMTSCSLRAAEACALDWQRLGRDREDDINTGYIAVHPEGLEVVLTRSKTSPTAAVTLPVPAQSMPRTVEWVTRWAALVKLEPGQPAFRSLRRGGRITAERLSPASVTPIVRQYVREHLTRSGMDADASLVASLNYTSHACRAGFLSSGAAAGTPEWRLRERSRHQNANVAAGYIRLQSGWDAKWGFEL